MKRILTILALICAMVVATNANPEADKQQKEGRKELAAAKAFYTQYEEGDTAAFALAVQHAQRALEIASQMPVLTDTLFGNTCLQLAIMYLFKHDYRLGAGYAYMAMNAYERELGRQDPLTIGTKIAFSPVLLRADARVNFTLVQQAFLDNESADKDKRITNIEDATMHLSVALEGLIAEYHKRFRYAVPIVKFEGNDYYLVQMYNQWHIGRPLVGWMAFIWEDEDTIDAIYDGNDIILVNKQTLQGLRVPSEKEKDINLAAQLVHSVNNPRYLKPNGDNTTILTLAPEEYRRVKTAYLDFLQHEK